MFTRADDTDKIIGGVVGGVVGFLVVIVLPVIVFFYIRKRKQGGFKGSDGKVQPHDEEEPRPWSFTAHEAPASIPPPPLAAQHEAYAYPPPPQLGGTTSTSAHRSMPRPVNEAQSASSSTPSSASASRLPTPLGAQEQNPYQGQPQWFANTPPAQHSSWTQPQPQAVGAPPHYVPEDNAHAPGLDPKTRYDGLRNEPHLMRNSSTGSGSGRQQHDEHAPGLSMSSIKYAGDEQGCDAAQASMPQIIPARALGYRSVLPPMDREKPKLPTVVPPQLPPTEGQPAAALQQQAGSMPGQGVRFAAAPQAGTGQPSTRPGVGLPGSMTDDLRFSKHGRCAEDSNNTIMGGGGN